MPKENSPVQGSLLLGEYKNNSWWTNKHEEVTIVFARSGSIWRKWSLMGSWLGMKVEVKHAALRKRGQYSGGCVPQGGWQRLGENMKGLFVISPS